MGISSFYSYLIRARRDLWHVVGETPEAVLARDVIPTGGRFHSIKDLLLHTPVVEDSWLHYQILEDQPYLESVPAIAEAQEGPHSATMPLSDILDYWRTVEANTRAYLSTLTPAELARSVRDDDDILSVEDILWHVLQHEVRHTAQIALLLRQAGVTPPPLLPILKMQEPQGSCTMCSTP
jgi:uncharacterized damage-inducible protein DinB